MFDLRLYSVTTVHTDSINLDYHSSSLFVVNAYTLQICLTHMFKCLI